MEYNSGFKGLKDTTLLTKVYLFECTFLGRCNIGVPSALGQPHATRSHMLTHHRRLIFAVTNVVDWVQIDSIFDCNSMSPWPVTRLSFHYLRVRAWFHVRVTRMDAIRVHTVLLTTTRILTYLLTPWSRVLLKKVTGSQLVKKFPAFYGTRRFIDPFTSARHLSLSWARSIQSTPPHIQLP
jgi:hypothetical protein